MQHAGEWPLIQSAHRRDQTKTVTSSPQQPLVNLSGVRFAYAEREILRGIDLQVPRGQVVAIMGGSGCGKTTLLRLIGGQLKATQGSVVVDGQELGALGREPLYRLRRRMGMLFQFGAL
ncbi:MAG: ATP-binding cassette domain-containing protein, partial [Rhodocyclaceae bacterium]|nr:ATP-binding cassette domain-containing protein [Rhodocyclaceae bacterium]